MHFDAVIYRYYEKLIICLNIFIINIIYSLQLTSIPATNLRKIKYLVIFYLLSRFLVEDQSRLNKQTIYSAVYHVCIRKNGKKKNGIDHLPQGKGTLIIRHKNEVINNCKIHNPLLTIYLFLQLKHHPKPSFLILSLPILLMASHICRDDIPEPILRFLLKKLYAS